MAKNRTNDYRLLSTELLSDSIKNSERYYLFASKHTNGDISSALEVPSDTEAYKNSVYFNMIFGKRIEPNDVVSLISRNDWIANTVYTQYDDTNVSLLNSNFYAIVNADSQYYVYKCLYNADGAPSTVEPDFSAINGSTVHYETSDGYVWKYMYTVNSSIVEKFSTNTKFPIIANTSVESNAVAGTIDLIVVENSGNNYNNYLAGNNTFNVADIAMNGNNLMYNIASNSHAVSVNGYYDGCYIYIKAGTSNEVGQYRRISSYIANSTSKTIVLESAFTNNITISAVYDIYPGVTVNGDGYQSVNAAARAIISPFGNTVSKIDILNTGAGYTRSRAYINVHPVVGASNASLRTISSPTGGHGSDQLSELGSKSIGISVTFANNQVDKILDTNDYRMIGLIKNPLFANVQINYKSYVGNFLTDETLYKINPVQVENSITVISTSPVVEGAVANFTSQFANGDFIYITDAATNSHFISKIVTVTNATSMVLESNVNFSSTNACVHIPNVSGNSVVSTSNTTCVVVNNLDIDILTDDNLIGYNSSAVAVANNTTISDDLKGFSTFINAYKYLGETISGSFTEDETIYQLALENASSVVHSTSVNGSNITIYATNQFGKFVPFRNIYGANSSAYCSTTKVYEPELVHRSGDILYMETISPVSRLPDQKETFKIILEF